MPISSMSANIAPGRRPRSSSAASMPAACSSASSASAAAVTAGSCFGLIMHTTACHGAMATGQIMPASSWFCSMAAATMRDTPMP